MFDPPGKYTTLPLLAIVAATSLAASTRRSSIIPAPAARVASLMSLAAADSPSARMTAARRSWSACNVFFLGFLLFFWSSVSRSKNRSED